MHYIDPEQLGVDMSRPAEFTEIHGAIRDHLAVPVALKSMGYDYIHLGGWWEPTATNTDADVSLRFQGSAEFSSALWSTTALSLIWPPSFGGTGPDGENMPYRALSRETALFAFDRLEETAARSGPDFVFTHVLIPHPAVRLQQGRHASRPARRSTRVRSGTTTSGSCSGSTSACCRRSIG